MTDIKECKKVLPEFFGAIRQNLAKHESLTQLSLDELDTDKKNAYAYLALVYNIRMCARLLILDIGACILAMPDVSETHYENRFFIKHMRGAIYEGYMMLCRKRKEWRGSLLYKLKSLVDRHPRQLELVNLYATVFAELDRFNIDNQDNTFRNLTFHYSDELRSVYDQTISIKSDDALKEATPFISVLGKLINLTLAIEETVKSDSTVRVPNVNVKPLPINDQVHKTAAGKIVQSGLTIDTLDSTITSIAISMSKTVSEISAYDQIVDISAKCTELFGKLGLKDVSLPKAEDLNTSANVYLSVYFMAIEYCSILKAYLSSNSMIERTLHLRKIYICGRGMLDVLYKKESENGTLEECYWKKIKEALATLQLRSNSEINQMESLLDDVSCEILKLRDRHVYVHYYKGNNANIKEFIDGLLSMNPLEVVLSVQLTLIVFAKLRDAVDDILKVRIQDSQADKQEKMAEIAKLKVELDAKIEQLKSHENFYEACSKYVKYIDDILKEYK